MRNGSLFNLVSRISKFRHKASTYKTWKKRRYAAPSPHDIKQACVLRNGIPDATWVETGTYLGDTTALLASVACKVYSLEPDLSLYAAAVRRFRNEPRVQILNGTSEALFPELLPKLRGNICYWLDGHFSGEGTHRGPLDTPVLVELDCVAKALSHTERSVVLIDDIRLFNGKTHSYGAYPTLDYLVDWARAAALSWHIEHDIFAARTP